MFPNHISLITGRGTYSLLVNILGEWIVGKILLCATKLQDLDASNVNYNSKIVQLSLR
jgi:hypothetical protein